MSLLRRSFRSLAVFLLLVWGWMGVAGAADGDVRAWPLFYAATDPVSHEQRLELLWPLYVHAATPGYAASQILSFPQSYPPAYAHQYYFMYPLSGLRLGDAGLYDDWFFPLWWSGSNGQGTGHAVLFPAWFSFWSPANWTLNIGMLCHNRGSATAEAHNLWPIWWSEWAKDGRTDSFYALLPLLWRNQDLSLSLGGEDRFDAGVFPAAWGRAQGKDSSSAYRWLIPLYFQEREQREAKDSKRRSESLWLFPWLEHEWENTERVTGKTSEAIPAADAKVTRRKMQALVPLYWQNDEETRTGEKLDRWGKTRLVLPLFGWDAREDLTRSQETTWALLYWQRQAKRGGGEEAAAGVFPLYWDFAERPSGQPLERARFLVPLGAHLYKEGEYETTNLLGPVLNRTAKLKEKSVRYDAFFPLWSITSGAEVAGGRFLPFAGGEVRVHQYRNFWYLFPLGWDYESQPETPAVGGSGGAWRLDQLESRRFAGSPADGVPERNLALYPFYWNRRTPESELSGLMPFYARDVTRRLPGVDRSDLYLPLLLGRYAETRYPHAGTRQDYLLSALAFAQGDVFRLFRIFPFVSSWESTSAKELWSLVAPFHYRSGWNPAAPEYVNEQLSIPLPCLPWYKSTHVKEVKREETRTRFFPFFFNRRLQEDGKDVHQLSVLWPLYDRIGRNGEATVSGLGGVANYRERDANGFVDQHVLYRLYRHKTRSWVTDVEVMPFFAWTRDENGSGTWSLLGGLLGGGRNEKETWSRIFFVPFRTSAGIGGERAESARRENAVRHAELALRYLKAERFDRAALEFTLARGARDDDAAFQLAAGEAYLMAAPERLEADFRDTLPSSFGELAVKGRGYNHAEITRAFRESAVVCFERALRLGADPRSVNRQLARCYDDLGRQEPARALLEENAKRFPSVTSDLELYQFQVRGVGKEAAAAAVAGLAAKHPDSLLVLWAQAGLATTDDDKLALYEAGARRTLSAEETRFLARRGLERAGLVSRARYGEFPDCGPGALGVPQQCADRALPMLRAKLHSLPVRNNWELGRAIVDRMLPLIAVRYASAPLGTARVPEYRRCGGYLDAVVSYYRLAGKSRDLLERFRQEREGVAGELKEAYDAWIEELGYDAGYLTIWRVRLLAPAASGTPVVRDFVQDTAVRYVDLDRLLGRVDRCTAEAACVVRAPARREAVLWIGFDYGLTVTVNGTTVFGPSTCKIAGRDELRVPVTLEQGDNRIVFTVTDDRLSYGFFARLSDRDGRYMDDIAVKIDHDGH